MVTASVADSSHERDSTEEAFGARVRRMGTETGFLQKLRIAAWRLLDRPQGQFAAASGLLIVGAFVLAGVFGIYGTAIDIPGFLSLAQGFPVLSALLVIGALIGLFVWAAFDIRKHEDKKAAEIDAKLRTLADEIDKKQSETLSKELAKHVGGALHEVASRNRSMSRLACLLDQRARWTNQRELAARKYEEARKAVDRVGPPVPLDPSLPEKEANAQRGLEEGRMQRIQHVSELYVEWERMIKRTVAECQEALGRSAPGFVAPSDLEVIAVKIDPVHQHNLDGTAGLAAVKRATLKHQRFQGFVDDFDEKLAAEIRLCLKVLGG